LAALTPATSLPPFGSQYRVVRKGQHYRADAALNSKKVGKLQIGEALVVQDAEMVDGKVRVLVARPTETDFVRLGWASVAVKGKTHLAPVGPGGVEEVEVFLDEDEYIEDADDEELSVELWSEGEYGFGISIGEASEVFVPEEDVADQSSQTCRTVVTMVDEGCSAQQLGVVVGMELLRIGSEELEPHGDAAVERAFEIVEEQQALGVGVQGGDPLVWVFRNPNRQSLHSPRSGSTRLMLRQFEVVRPATVRNGIGLNSKRLGQLQVGQMIVAMAHAELDGHVRLQIASDPEQWVSATVPDGTVLLREQGLIGIEDFGEVDTDGDGFMSRAEFTAYRQKQTGHPPTAADWEAFDAADVDGDGQISVEEFKRYRDAIEDRHNSNRPSDNRAQDYQQQRQQRSVTFANQEMEPLMPEEQPMEEQQPQTGSLAWTDADIDQIFNAYDRNMDGLLEHEDVLDILIHEMGYEDDDGTSGVADGLMREFGEEMEVAQDDGHYAYARMLSADHWAALCKALCNHLLQLDVGSGVGDTLAHPPTMPRGSTTQVGYDNYEYDAETGGIGGSGDVSSLQRQLKELERHNAEMALKIMRGEQERVVLLVLLAGALGFVVLLLFTDLIITKK
jgi:Ca2+-binding EF-hand superfamily protein